MRRKPHRFPRSGICAPISNRAFLRRIGEEERSEARLQEALEDDLRFGETISTEARVEVKLVLKQILSMCDRKTRAIIWGRIEGRSWDGISYDVVMSNHAARLHYSKTSWMFSANRRNISSLCCKARCALMRSVISTKDTTAPIKLLC